MTSPNNQNKQVKRSRVPVNGTPSHIAELYGASLATLDHHPTQVRTPRRNSNQAGTWFTYPGGMKG